MTGLTLGARVRPRRPGAAAGASIAALVAIALAVLISAEASDVSPLAPPAAAVLVVLPVWMFVNRRVELSLAVLMVYLGLLDGVIKLKTNVEGATLLRDMLLFAIAAGMLARSTLQRRELRLPPMSGWVFAWTAVVAVQLLNPLNGSWLHSISSLRQDLEFVPLFFIGFLVVTNVQRLRVFLMLLLALAAVNGAVGLVQSGLSPEQLSGWGPGYAELIDGPNGAPRTSVGADGERKVRPPGLGSDMGFAGILGAVALPGGLALLLSRRRGSNALWLCSPLIVLAVVGVMTSQSRSALITAIVAALAFVGLLALSRQASKGILTLIGGGVLIAVSLLIVTGNDKDALFRYRSITPNKITETTVQSRSGTFSAIPDYVDAFPFGAGYGSVGPAAGMIGESPIRKPNAESQFTYLIAEVGVPGLLLFLAFYTRLLAVVLIRVRRVRFREHQLLLAGLAAPLFAFAANWIVGVNTVSTPNSPYLWFAAGVLSYWLLTREPVSQPELSQQAVR